MSSAETSGGPVVLEEARLLFQSENLPLPFVPAKLEANLHKIASWVYGTRPDAPPLYRYQRFLEEARSAPLVDFVQFGHDGHGINSWAMHYYLNWKGLHLCIQSAWGGAYMDKAEASTIFLSRMALAEQLVQAVEESPLKERLHEQEGRLVVGLSDFYESGVGLYGIAPGELPPLIRAGWNEDHEPLQLAREILRLL